MTEYDYLGDSSSSVEPELTSWETYRNHREIVTRLIRGSAPPNAQSLAVLGAGLCNDLDLPRLLAEFESIHLYDLSEADVESGLRFQKLANERRIKVCHLEVTGQKSNLEKYKLDGNESMLGEVMSGPTTTLFQQYDCIVSTCLLSQLLFHVYQCVGDQHPHFVDLLQLFRRNHVQTMIDSLTPRGTGILVTDFVSSESIPDLLMVSDLKGCLRTAISDQNYLHGLNPALVVQTFYEDEIKSRLKGIKITDPWRWVLPTRVYACFAVAFNRL